jgi:hypothetical protein
MAQRMERTHNRDKTRATRLTAGVDFLGVQFGKRKSPTSGKNISYLFPAKSAHPTIPNKLTHLTRQGAKEV